jgi:hypothetical protein
VSVNDEVIFIQTLEITYAKSCDLWKGMRLAKFFLLEVKEHRMNW